MTLYDDVAAQWWSDEIRWVRTLKNLVPPRMKWFGNHVDWTGQAVLDVGCAGGFMTEALAANGASVTGIDPAADAIQAARAHATDAGYDIRYDVGVGEDLPYPDAAFDTVVCVDVLEHVSDYRLVVREIARVLKLGGTFLFDTINRTLSARLAAITIAEDVLRILPKGTHDPDFFITPRELLDAMRGAGLEAGPMTGLGPRGINRHGDLVFGRFPVQSVLYMGMARKPASRDDA